MELTQEFLYGVYEELDGEDLFPPGIDEYSVNSSPIFINVAGARYEAGSIENLLAKVIGAYERHRSVSKQGSKKKNTGSAENS